MKYVLLLMMALAIGCVDPPAVRLETESEQKDRLAQYGKTHLPRGATEVQEIGNGWITFELYIGGKNRKYMYRKVYQHYNNGVKTESETIVELKDE